MRSSSDCDVLLFGGGIAGLWALDALRRRGYGALLVEKTALGAGQTIQSQGIVHGGGKYALRGVRDLEAVRAIAGMPARWLACFDGKDGPDLRAARLRSRSCLLWVPKTGFFADLVSKGMMSIVVGAGMLAAKPEELPRNQWPAALRGGALKVYAMAEPVLDTGSVLAALLAANAGRVRRAAGVEFALDRGEVRLDGATVRPRAVVFAAGAGNEALLAQIGDAPGRMQRRPVTILLLRGNLPQLHGHCVVKGKAHFTVTSVEDGRGRTVWQVGGDLSERIAGAADPAAARAEAVSEVRKFLPTLDLSGADAASYPAVRAEAATAGARRPSGVHVERVRAGLPVFAAWPTKLALAPLFADEVVGQVSALGPPTGAFPDGLASIPAPGVASPPWEEAAWSPVL